MNKSKTKDEIKKAELKRRIETEVDFIKHPKTGNSLRRYMIKFPDGVSIEEIGKVLMLKKEEVAKRYDNIVEILKKWMG